MARKATSPLKKDARKKSTSAKNAQKIVVPPRKKRPYHRRNIFTKLRIKRRMLRVVQAFFRELIKPFWYVFRYHFFVTLCSITCSLLILGTAYVVYDVAFKDLPSVNELTGRKQLLTTKILDRNNQLLYRIYKNENRTLIPLKQIPANVIHATVAIEDRSFYSHRGISLRGIFRALRSNSQSTDHLQGGSTITQQLVKNTLLTPERTFKRKIREIILAFLVEGSYTKDQILEMYLNQVSYGGSTYGIEEAAERYFGVPATKLSLAQSAFLAGLPAAPTIYSPFGSSPEYAYARQHEVLRRMVEDNYISQAQADAAKNETLTFKADSTEIKAPHFVMYVRSLLEGQYGEDVVSQGGLEVTTTLDLDTQNQSQDLVTKEVASLQRLRISNGAAIVTNPKSGEILAMVGSTNYFDFAHDGQVNVTTRPRQPGSSIKPVTYSVALGQGMTPDTMILDEPISFSLPGSPVYAPKNYDGKFHGNVPLRVALASSYNVPAVKTLASVGLNTMIDQAENMGITTWKDRRRFGLSLTLGSGEVLMTDMAQVYGTFANFGQTVPLNPILQVKNARGEVLYRNTCALDHLDCPGRQVLDPRVAYEITDILSDNGARTPAFGPQSVLNIPNQQVAVKTGTTNNLKDNWSIGYTSNRVVATWVGNNDGTPMSYVASGITGASPIWNKIMRTQLDDAHPHVFASPDGYIKVAVCAETNTLPCQGCPHVQNQIFVAGTEPKTACQPSFFYHLPQQGQQPQSQVTTNTQILDGVTISN